MREPSSAPSSTSNVEWTPDSTRVCATSSAITNAIDETTKRWCAPGGVRDRDPGRERDRRVARTAARPAAAFPRPVHAFAAITPATVIASATSVSAAGASRSRSSSVIERSPIRSRRSGTRPRSRSSSRSAPRRPATSFASFAIGSNDVVATSIAPSIAVLIISAISTNVIEISSAISSIFETDTTTASTITRDRDDEVDAQVPLRAERVDDPLERVVERVEDRRRAPLSSSRASSRSRRSIASPWS